MNRPVIILGIGEIGSVFARGFLRLGHPVYPVTRSGSIRETAEQVPEPAAVIIAVGETDLPTVLKTIPENWKDSLVLLQNELLPRDWQEYDFRHPTIMSVWFEKKKGQDVKVVVPSVVHGPNAELLASALGTLEIPVEILHGEERLLFELVRKNLYILTTNIAGLETGGTVSDLWQHHRELAKSVAREVLDIQESLTGETLDKEKLLQAMLTAFDGDPDHMCMGRSAPARLARALEQARQADINTPILSALAEKHID